LREPQLEKLFRIEADVAAGYPSGPSHQIVSVLGGQILGQGRCADLKGEIIAPSGDWLSVTETGLFMLDVRMSARFGSDILYITYQGRALMTEAHTAKIAQGEALTRDDISFVGNPIMQSIAPSFSWVQNHIFVSTMQELIFATQEKPGRIIYDVFCVT